MDVLHELIKTMSPSERGYFKKYTSSLGGGDYVQLFDVIGSMDRYDEKKLLKRFKKATFIRHLSRTKNYLYNSIIRVLLLYHEESSPRLIGRNLLNEAEMLLNKGLLKQARKLVEKAKTIATEGEWLLNLIDALALQRLLCNLGIYKPGELNLQDLIGETDLALAKLTNMNEYAKLAEQVHEMARPSLMLREVELKEKISVVMAHPLLQNEDSALSVKARFFFNYINSFIHITLQNYEVASPFGVRAVELLKTYPEFVASNPQIMLDAYNTVLSSANFDVYSKYHEKYLYEFKNFQVKTSWLNSVKFQYYAAYALSYFTKLTKEHEFLEAAEDALHKLEVYHQSLKTELRLGLYVTLTHGYMIFGRYDEAKEVIEVYRKYPPKNIRKDYQIYLHFFYLIAQFETGNELLVRNLISNVSRFLKHNGQFGEIESMMLQVFELLLKEPASKSRVLQLDSLKQAMLKGAENTGGRNWDNYLSIIMPFIESKIKGIKYHRYVLENAKTR